MRDANGGAAYDALNAEAISSALWIDDDDWIEADIPLRPWVAQGYALRGAVTLVCGPPSSLKSSLMLGWASSICLRLDYGDFHPACCGPVIVYNVEDDEKEQRRRLSAVLRQFGATPADIKGKVIRTGPGNVGTLIEYETDNRQIVSTHALWRLEQVIIERKPSTLIVDPFSELHNAEENDNTAIRAVIAAFRALAVKYNIAVIILHHTRKGSSTSPGDPDIARGASAIIGAVRIALTVIGMSEDDAKAFGMATEHEARSHYVRVDDAKQNYAPIREAEWFEKVVHRLDNGEYVPAATPWTPPEAKTASQTDLAALATAIARGTPSGEPWSPQLSTQTSRSVRALLEQHGFHGADAQKATLLRLHQLGLVLTANYKQPGRRHPAKGLRFGDRPQAGWLPEEDNT